MDYQGQSQGQQDQGDYVPSYGVPQMPRGDRADLLDKIKPDLLIEVIRHRLMGEEFLDGVWVPVKILRRRALSDVGAWEIANLMLSTASINVSISKLEDSEIKARIRRIARTAQIMCVSNWRDYGIREVSQLHFVNDVVFTNGFVVLKQAGGGSIQELLKGTVHEDRHIMSESKPPSRIKSIFGLG